MSNPVPNNRQYDDDTQRQGLLFQKLEQLEYVFSLSRSPLYERTKFY